MMPAYGDGDKAKRDMRDSVFLHAAVSASDGSHSDIFRIRNISRGGLMAEGPILFADGDEVDIELRNIGRVHGKVMWSNDRRFGLAFDHLIDPMLARKPVGTAAIAEGPRFDRPIVPLLERRGLS